jgi:hypothetical protein
MPLTSPVVILKTQKKYVLTSAKFSITENNNWIFKKCRATERELSTLQVEDKKHVHHQVFFWVRHIYREDTNSDYHSKRETTQNASHPQ